MRKRLSRFRANPRLRYWLHEWGYLSLAAVVAIAASIARFAWFRVENHVHDGNVRAVVLSSNSVASDEAGFRTGFHVRLPDGSTAYVSTRRMDLAHQVVETACLERRRKVDSGRFFYRLADRANCPPGDR